MSAQGCSTSCLRNELAEYSTLAAEHPISITASFAIDDPLCRQMLFKLIKLSHASYFRLVRVSFYN